MVVVLAKGAITINTRFGQDVNECIKVPTKHVGDDEMVQIHFLGCSVVHEGFSRQCRFT